MKVSINGVEIEACAVTLDVKHYNEEALALYLIERGTNICIHGSTRFIGFRILEPKSPHAQTISGEISLEDHLSRGPEDITNKPPPRDSFGPR